MIVAPLEAHSNPTRSERIHNSTDSEDRVFLVVTTAEGVERIVDLGFVDVFSASSILRAYTNDDEIDIKTISLTKFRRLFGVAGNIAL